MDIDDLKHVIVGMGMTQEQHSVLTGSMAAFVKKVEASTGPLKHDPKLNPTVGTFMGIAIKEDSRLPPNRALLKQGHEVIAVINLD